MRTSSLWPLRAARAFVLADFLWQIKHVWAALDSSPKGARWAE
jgi:hypothetical protein